MKVTIQEFEDGGKSQKGLFFDGVLFDWGMDEASLVQAKIYSLRDETSKIAVHGDIQNNFLKSLAEFIGRPVTLPELLAAIKKGEL